MAENKTKPTAQSVLEFIEAVPNELKRAEAMQLVELYTRVTGNPPIMWGPSIIGFGSYHYKYASGREGDAPLAGFAIRNTELNVYMCCDQPTDDELLAQLGKHRKTVSCVYIKKLSDIDMNVLEKLIRSSIKSVQEKYPNSK